MSKFPQIVIKYFWVENALDPAFRFLARDLQLDKLINGEYPYMLYVDDNKVEDPQMKSDILVAIQSGAFDEA